MTQNDQLSPQAQAPAAPKIRRRDWRLRCAAIGAGAIAGLGHPPLSALWLALPALAVVFYLFRRARSAKQAALVLWLAGLGYFAVSLSWLVNPFLVVPWRHGWMAPFALSLMAGGLALLWAWAGALAYWLGPTKPRRALALVALLTLAELSRAYLFTGFPWATIGHVFIGWPQMQLAALGGAGLLSLVALAIAALLAGAVKSPRGWRRVLAAVLILAGATGYGLWRQKQGRPGPALGVVRLVQPVIPQSLKWEQAAAEANYETLFALTAEAPGPLGAPDLTIWPETAFPYFLDGAEPLLAQVRQVTDGQLFIGAPRSRPGANGDGVSNSLAEIGADGLPLQVYDKHHLVPFGEYVPFGTVLGALGLRAMVEQGSFTPGPGPQLLDAGKLGQVLPLICYEAIFPQDILSAPARPGWLLQVTNDAWFGTIQGPYQHLAQARLRAVETGLPLLRAANTGVSAAIDPFGRMTAELALGKRGILDTMLPAPLPATAYWKYGDLPLLVLLGLALAALAATRRRVKVD